MVVAGGRASPDGLASDASPVTDGAAWDAATNTWHAIAPMPATLPGYDPTAVWTGREVLVWSSASATPTPTGGRLYSPTTPRPIRGASCLHRGSRLDKVRSRSGPVISWWSGLASTSTSPMPIPTEPASTHGRARGSACRQRLFPLGALRGRSGRVMTSCYGVVRPGRAWRPDLRPASRRWDGVPRTTRWRTSGAPCRSRHFEPSPARQRCGRDASSSSSVGLQTGSCPLPAPGRLPSTRKATPGRRCQPRPPILRQIPMGQREPPTNARVLSPSGPERRSCSWAAATTSNRVPDPTESAGHRLVDALARSTSYRSSWVATWSNWLCSRLASGSISYPAFGPPTWAVLVFTRLH